MWEEKLAENRCPKSGEEMEATGTEIAMKSDQERLEKIRKKDRQKELETADRERSKKKWEEEKRQWTRNSWQIAFCYYFFNMNSNHIQENNNNKLQFDPSLVK